MIAGDCVPADKRGCAWKDLECSIKWDIHITNLVFAPNLFC